MEVAGMRQPCWDARIVTPAEKPGWHQWFASCSSSSCTHIFPVIIKGHEKQLILNRTTWVWKTPKLHGKNEKYLMFSWTFYSEIKIMRKQAQASEALCGKHRKAKGMFRNIHGHKGFPLWEDELGHLSTEEKAQLKNGIACGWQSLSV